MNIVINLNAAARNFAQVESALTAVERMHEYTLIESEESE